MSTAAATDNNKTLARLFNGRRFPMLLLILMPLMLASSMHPTSVKAQASSTTIKLSDSFPFSFFNDCTGEIVSGVVQVKTTIHMTADANGGLHARFHDVFREEPRERQAAPSMWGLKQTMTALMRVVVGPSKRHSRLTSDSSVRAVLTTF